MPSKRRTESQKRAERDEAVSVAWESFRPKLAALRSYKDGLALVASAPPESAPGRKFYSNLGFFLQSFRVPSGSSDTERRMYLALFEHFEIEGALKRETRIEVEKAFRAEMTRSI